MAGRRLEVSREVLSAVRQAQAEEVLHLRDDGGLNDQTCLDLQLELERGELG